MTGRKTTSENEIAKNCDKKGDFAALNAAFYGVLPGK
jgi:hypothetical protein